MSCRRWWVTGRVQGVAFRAATRDQARSLGLVGQVRNLPDGRVEVLACGEEAPLQTLDTWLHHGPPAARVAHLEWVEVAMEAPLDFNITR